jgi:hypothetical protein
MKVEINIPTSLDEIPLKRYQDFIKVQQNSNDEELIAQKMIEIFCGIDLKDVVKIKVTDLNDLIEHFGKLFSERPELKRTFKLGEYEFGFIPNLEEITFGEYVDLDSHIQSWENYHKAMAVLYRPIKTRRKENYEIIDYEPNPDIQELMKFAPLSVAISASLFFYNLEKELLIATMSYLQRETKKITKTSATSQKGDNLTKDGVGMEAYMQSLKAMLQNLTKLQDLDLLNVSPISPSKSKKTKSKQTNLKNNIENDRILQPTNEN